MDGFKTGILTQARKPQPPKSELAAFREQLNRFFAETNHPDSAALPVRGRPRHAAAALA